jgi:hypothetical protein
MANAAMAKHRRQAFAAVCLAPTSNLLNAGDRVGFISVPQFVLLWKKVFIQKNAASATP